jgi:predicted O-linked N-acetylglucosamine transferase (SPINDLY family)
VREAHAACGRALGQAPVGAAFPGSLDPDRCLRIGFMSPDFRAHSAAYFIAPLLRALDRGTFEPIAYAAFDEFPPDAMTDEFRRLCPQWRDISGLRGEPLDRAIRSDRVDVLVDLAGHTAGHRLETLARRPAPVIASWLGYPCTTGIPGVDLRIVDAITDPAPEADAFATERLARIDGCFVCYGARPDAPAPDLLPPGAPVFGSFNNIAKLDQPVVALWSRLLHEAPGSRLLLKSANLGQHAVREHTEARFAAHGVSADRLELVGGLPALDHLAFYSRMHVALDPFPYSGTTTTCEALWMGVPVVTLAGRSHAGRVGMSLLSAAGMPDLVAGSPREYVRIANELAADQGRLRALRAGLRERLRSSGLCDGPGFARRFGALIREEWRRWCAAGGLGAPKNPP